MKKTQIFVAIFILLIMIFSAIGFVYTNPDNANQNSLDYKGFKFVLNQNNQYQIDINDNSFIFDYNPNDLSNIDIPEFNLVGDKYYILVNYSDVDNNLEYNLGKLGYTLNLLGVRPVLACDNEQNCEENLPVKDCSSNSFYFVKGSLNKVYLDNKCIVIEGDTIGMSRSVDKINLKLINVE